MKSYVGTRTPERLDVHVEGDEKGARRYRLPHIVVHSPTGFECGLKAVIERVMDFDMAVRADQLEALRV